VTDQTGAVVEGATVTVTDPATGVTRSTVSSATGLYEVPGLNAGNYNMKVVAKGFQQFAQNGIVVNISNTFRVDVKLTVGSDTTTVTVQADALTVQADSNVVSTLINEQQITEIATNGRNVVALAALGLGVSGNLPDSNMPTSVGSNFAISFNGLNQAHNIWLLDGGEAYDRGSGGKSSVMPSQDALGEFQVLASNYPPDYGISSGGTVSMSIKAGTSKFHGEAWEFMRNDAFDAHTYFDNNNGQHAPIPELRYNVFGANLGGPVFIPHVYNRNRQKTFFFVNEEWRRIIQGTSTSPINTVPQGDAPTSAADFVYNVPVFNNSDQLAQGVGNQIFVPTVADPVFNQKLAAAGLTPGQPFPGNKIPGSLLDPNALLFNATKNVPVATNSNDTYTPTGITLPTYVREDLFRIDHNINDKWQLFGHFVHDSVSQNYATVLWSGDNYPTIGSNFVNPSYMSTIKLTGTLAPEVLLEADFSYNGNKIQILPVSAGGASGYSKPSGWSAASYFQDQIPGDRLPNLAFSTFGTNWQVNTDPWHNGAEDYAENVALSVTKGKHAMKFGLGYNRYTKNQIIGSLTQGSYTFGDGWNTSTHTPSGPLTGDSYLDFELGLSTQFQQANADSVFHYVNNTISLYAMDNWHVTNRLSLQYGLRYDALPHAWERTNSISNFVQSAYQSALAPVFNSDGSIADNSPGVQTVNGLQYYMNGVVIAGQDGSPRGMVTNDYNTLQPRVGFSYDLTGNGKTVLRGGFGTFYERLQGNDIYDVAGNAPFVSTPTATNVELTNTSYNWQSGGAAAKPLFVNGPNSLATRYKAPGVAMYSLGVQREIVPSLVLVTQYVGNIAWHQNTFLPINNFTLATPLSPPAGCQIGAAPGQTGFVQGTCAISRQVAAGAGKDQYGNPYSLSSRNTNLARNYVGFNGMNQISNILTGSYNSAQIGLRQQSRHGLSFEVDYTWAHEIDDQVGSNDLDTTSNPWNLKYDKGSGSLDRRNILNINYTYKMPFFNASSGLVHSLLGGWELSGVIISQSGLPWAGSNTPASGYADTIGLGSGYTNRPDVIGHIHYPKAKTTVGGNSGYQWVSGDAFAAPTAAWDGGSSLGFGNEGRDAVVGPGRSNFTTSLYKSFAFTERAHFEFRVDSFNTFNHTQFNAFNNAAASSNFGFVTGAQDPREFQFGGKIVF